MTGFHAIFQVEPDAGIAEVSRVSDALGELWSGRGLPEEARMDVSLVLEEALSNVIRHSRPRQAHLDVRFEEGAIELRLEDDGPAFDPLSHPAPDLDAPLDQRRPGGLGIHLIKRLMDRCRYERRGNLNRLTMVKRLNGG